MVQEEYHPKEGMLTLPLHSNSLGFCVVSAFFLLSGALLVFSV